MYTTVFPSFSYFVITTTTTHITSAANQRQRLSRSWLPHRGFLDGGGYHDRGFRDGGCFRDGGGSSTPEEGAASAEVKDGPQLYPIIPQH
jgi:hypothetical protein